MPDPMIWKLISLSQDKDV